MKKIAVQESSTVCFRVLDDDRRVLEAVVYQIGETKGTIEYPSEVNLSAFVRRALQTRVDQTIAVTPGGRDALLSAYDNAHVAELQQQIDTLRQQP